MTTLDAVQTLEKVDAGVKLNAPEVRKIKGMEVGQIVRQGDIYIHKVKADHPHGKKLKDRQLAIGNTQGSRHMASADAEVYEGKQAPEWAPRALLGPLVKLFKRSIITHPEHAHVELEPGNYQVTHQMDARTLQRVRD